MSTRDAALARVRGLTDPSAAWQALGYVEDHARVFRRVAEAPAGPDWIDVSYRLANMDGGRSSLSPCFILDRAHPHSVEDAVAFATHANDMVVVETLAREYVRALERWAFEGNAPTKIGWRFPAADGSRSPRVRGIDPRVVAECLEAALESDGFVVVYDERSQIALPLGTLWREALSRGLSVPRELEDPYGLNGASGPTHVPDPVRGVRFADLIDPFPPLEKITALGYRIESIRHEDITILAVASRT